MAQENIIAKGAEAVIITKQKNNQNLYISDDI